MQEIDYAGIRTANLQMLETAGFKVAGGLPLGPRGEITTPRSLEEIGRRLWALNCLFNYVAAGNNKVPSMRICKCMLRSDLRPMLTDSELQVIDGWRSTSQQRHIDTIGWRLENMLPLAWILGFTVEPGVDGDMLEGESVNDLIEGFIGSLDQQFNSWLSEKTPRSNIEVIACEDLFYCAHNAVRSAQLGQNTVPTGFDPLVSGGVIHERRHALTWAVSPGVSWDETDLST